MKLHSLKLNIAKSTERRSKPCKVAEHRSASVEFRGLSSWRSRSPHSSLLLRPRVEEFSSRRGILLCQQNSSASSLRVFVRVDRRAIINHDIRYRRAILGAQTFHAPFPWESNRISRATNPACPAFIAVIIVRRGEYFPGKALSVHLFAVNKNGRAF